MSHHHSFTKIDPQASEYFWGCVLTKDSPTVTWSFTEEDDDTDFLEHTLSLRIATLGPSAVNKERNIVQVETTNFEKQEIKQPLLSLTCGLKDSLFLDISFGGKTPVVFRLIEGSGPVHLSGQQLVEYPPEDIDVTQDETVEDEEVEELDNSMVKDKTSNKRKADIANGKPKKKGKLEVSESDDDPEEDEDEDMDDDEEQEDEEEEDDEDEYEPAKNKKGKAAKPKPVVKKGAKPQSKVIKKVEKVKKIKK